MRGRGSRWLAAVNAVIYAYLMMPLIIIVLFSFSDRSFFAFPPTGFSFRWYERAWETGVFIRPALLSIVIGVMSSAIAATLAIPAVLALRRSATTRIAAVLEVVLLTPLIVPGLIIGIALLYAYSRFRLIDNFAALLFAHVLIVFPFMFRSVMTSAFNLKKQHEEASEILGASAARTFRKIILPQLRGGIASGAIFAFIISFDQFTVSLFVTQSEQTTLPVAIYKYLYDVNDPVAAAVSTVLVAFGLVVTFLIQRAGWLDQLGRSGA
jgi:putative spermidine/putrescine transport system permease protein